MNTKALIIGEILKLDKPFKPRDIIEEIGVSSQNFNNHMARLIDKGILSRHKGVYNVINREALIEEMVGGSDFNKLTPATDTRTLPIASNLNTILEWCVALRALQDIRYGAMQRALNEEIDEALEELKRAKRYLNRRAMSERTAEKVPTPDLKKVWDTFSHSLSFYFTMEDFLQTDMHGELPPVAPVIPLAKSSQEVVHGQGEGNACTIEGCGHNEEIEPYYWSIMTLTDWHKENGIAFKA